MVTVDTLIGRPSVRTDTLEFLLTRYLAEEHRGLLENLLAKHFRNTRGLQ
jgi:hypothetical protein